jgi:hypothetical protein
VLDFLAKAACYFDLNTVQRLIRNVPRLDDWASQLRRIKEIDEVCQRLAARSAFEDQREGAKTLANILEQQRTSIQELAQILKVQFDNNTKVVKWISKIEVESDHSLIRQKLGTNYAESGQWLRPRYQSWMDPSSKPTFWLCGSCEYMAATLWKVGMFRTLKIFLQLGLARVLWCKIAHTPFI